MEKLIYNITNNVYFNLKQNNISSYYIYQCRKELNNILNIS
jgi:hypothetical protein